MSTQLYDIEVFPNFFCVGLKDYVTKKVLFYEISEEKNDLDKIYNFFNTFNGFLVSFNGLHYDNVVMNYFLENYKKYKHKSFLEITLDLKAFSDKIIFDDADFAVKAAKYRKNNWTDIDLFMYWSKGLRISKQISLKALGIQLGYPVIQELPYHPDTILTIEDLPKLRYYNYTHDLGILELLLNEMKGDVKLRQYLKQEYNIKCWSWDAPKIASEALLRDYCKATRKDIQETRKLVFYKPTLHLDKCLEGFDPQFELPVFKKLWQEVLSSVDSYSKEIIVSYNNTNIKLSYGIGGLHSVNENEQYHSDDNVQVITSDIASLYPNLIINYGCIRFPQVLDKYIQVKADRLVAKRNKDKVKDTFLKLILNSTSGLLDNQYSWLYYPEGAMRLRLIGQLFLTKCIEVCCINNWQVVSANTDGIEVIVPKAQLELYEQTLNDIAISFNLEFEHEYYNKIIYKNVSH